MLKTSLFFVSLTALGLVSAAPPGQREEYAWSPALAGYYQKVALHIQEAKDSGVPSACDLAGAAPPPAPTPLPGADGLVLAHVAVGRGVQNYTCASNSPNIKPVAAGALAHLYNASCMAASFPDLLALMPDLALQYPLPNPGVPSPADSSADTSTLLSSYSRFTPSDIALSGHHFFSEKTPVFELNSNPSGPATHLGIVKGKANANSTAPAGSCPGVGWKGNGAVAWLFLDATEQSETTEVVFDGVNDGAVVDGGASAGASGGKEQWKHIYRVNTAGGMPPKTCEGIEVGEVISVQYAANYWYYKGAE